MPQKNRQKEKRTLGIYVHIPFCVKKCEYCDFLSMPAGRDVQEQYMRALLREMETKKSTARGYVVDSIFIGGGTPSLVDAEWIAQILETIGSCYPIDGNLQKNGAAEVTIECNPGTLDAGKLDAYKEAGINRISLGLQSACNEELRLLGRIHTWEQFLGSADLVRERFDNWNVDIMSALPGQSIDSYRHTLQSVLALQPSHISAYSLIIEEGTPFYEKYEEDDRLRQQGRSPVLLPDEETEREMYELTKQLLGEQGYHRYEISNYAREGCESRHNNRYWLREDYIGFGLGAASCMNNTRWHNVTDMQQYLRQSEAFLREEVQELTIEEQMEETMFLGLRRMQGVDCEAFGETFGRTVQDIYGEVIRKLELQKLLQYSGKYIQLTQLGIDVSNYVLAQFLLGT